MGRLNRMVTIPRRGSGESAAIELQLKFSRPSFSWSGSRFPGDPRKCQRGRP